MVAIAQSHGRGLREAVLRLHAMIAQRSAHPSKTVVLVPFFHLLRPVAMQWAEISPSGFSPRFETTRTWAGAAGFVAGPTDLALDMGRDLLTARALLESAGLAARADLLAARLVEAAWQVASSASAVPPEGRAAWAGHARAKLSAGHLAAVLMLEDAVARIALEWAAASAYEGDVLLQQSAMRGLDLLVVLEGLRTDPLTATIANAAGDKCVKLSIADPGDTGTIRIHAAEDPADEAERAAACVLRHVEEGRVPVALVAIDRVLTRRVRAMLDSRGVAIRDETGWKLSTTRSAAHVMLALRGSAWNAGCDAVIDWLKNSPAAKARAVLALEKALRRAGVREWQSLGPDDAGESQSARLVAAQVNAWREELRGSRSLPQWLAALRRILQSTGQWPGLVSDAAGGQIVTSLRLEELGALELDALPQAQRRMSLHEFTGWVRDSLESENFIPDAPDAEQVVILPLHQMVGRQFASLVAAGCDESNLATSPEPAGLWSPQQREDLGLPTRQSQEAELRAAWQIALGVPECDLLWRRNDASGEPLLPSPLVQELSLNRQVLRGVDARQSREITAQPTPRPNATGSALQVLKLSASAYEDLRRCPYRFFALRQLGLQEADEIETEVDKRDFGNWLHRVLSQFHTGLAQRHASPADWSDRLDESAREVTRSMRLDDGEFLPFASAWPRVRDGYLEWLKGHEAEGARFALAESDHEVAIGAIKLAGRIDRIDHLSDGVPMVLDYKTENIDVSRARVRIATEDTQLAFYAALMPQDTVQAAYVNVGERSGTATVAQPSIVAARDLLIEGVLGDMRRIAEGQSLAALGEGKVCDFCAARGLCRRDFWSDGSA